MKKGLIFISILVIIDQLIKYLIRKYLDPHDIIPILPGFNIVHVMNKGAAFGILRDLGNSFFIIMSIIAISIIVYLFINDKQNFISYSLILSGAIGNLIDRISMGHVTDFIDLYAGRFHWPAFNVADSCLTLGIFLFGINTIISGRRVDDKGRRTVQER